jgi:hypothetical protein
LRDLTVMARTLVAGAVAPLPKSLPARPAAKKTQPRKVLPKKSAPKKTGGRT